MVRAIHFMLGWAGLCWLGSWVGLGVGKRKLVVGCRLVANGNGSEMCLHPFI